MLNPPNKKKKPCYSLEQKLAAVDALKSGEKTRKVAEDFVSIFNATFVVRYLNLYCHIGYSSCNAVQREG